jgi:hypothetical protein
MGGLSFAAYGRNEVCIYCFLWFIISNKFHFLTKTLDSAVYISLYLFDATHRMIDLELTTHHIISISATLFMYNLRHHSPSQHVHAMASLLFTPFFIPGITLADPLIDLSSLIYALASRTRAHGKRAVSLNILSAETCLWISATLHLFFRVVQWCMILSYTISHWNHLHEVAGRSLYTLPIALSGWGKMEFTDAYVLFLLPDKLAKKKAAVAQGSMGNESAPVTGDRKI